MNRYTIYCSEEQTKKALNLGAPLEINEGKNTVLCRYQNYNTYKRCVIPTTEQMIGWLEEQDEICEVNVGMVSTEKKTNNWSFAIYIFVTKQDYDVIIAPKEYFDRKEATIAAIDAALEYLTENKK